MGKSALELAIYQLQEQQFLLTVDFLSSLKNYLLLVYYANCPITVYFQIQFIRVSCILNARNKITNSIRNRRKNSAMKIKYHDNPESQKEYEKRKFKENPELRNECQRKKNQGKNFFFNKVEKFHQ